MLTIIISFRSALHGPQTLDSLNQPFSLGSYRLSESPPQQPAYAPLSRPTLPLAGVLSGSNAPFLAYPLTTPFPQPYPDLVPYTNARVTRGRYDPAQGARLREENERLNPYNPEYRSRVDHPPQRARSRSPESRNLMKGNRLEVLLQFVNEDSSVLTTALTPRHQGPPRHRQGQEIAKPEDEQKDPECEFSAPCRMGPSPDGMHWRKVVSHVFGRNKASTKLFPQYVWVHYCRKHYQRARYRADQWPFTQCDLLLESLNRMERWGGVDSFELILRRREQLRVDNEPDADSNEQLAGVRTTASTTRKETRASRALGAPQRSRKHPTAINAPVPLWLRQLVGKSKSFDNIRELVEHVRTYLGDLRKEERAEQLSLSMSPSLSVSPRHAAGKARKRPMKTTEFKNNQRLQTSRVRFPDVEILPTFKSWVVEAALRQRSTSKQEVKEESQHPHIPDNERVVELDDAESNQGSQTGPADTHPAAHTPDVPVDAAAVEGTQDHYQSRIGRAGTNSGNSESQRRRSQRVYVDLLNRVSGHGSVKKPRDPKR
ncbi:hypothetical protein N7522_004142 [Penicillium canescens]|nr:hypothetical protein N7522_004142 [Penicillium canescens]